MGCSFSCKRIPSSYKKSSTLKKIKIVHLNGYIEELESPLTVAQVIGKPQKHFLFTQIQLLSACSTPLKQDMVLEPGRVYFLLPHSLFDSRVSPVDLAPIARKLGSIARTSRSKSKPTNRNLSSSVKSITARSCNKPVSNSETVEVFCGMHKYSKSKSWKPILATIREISTVNCRSEPDLQECVKG